MSRYSRRLVFWFSAILAMAAVGAALFVVYGSVIWTAFGFGSQAALQRAEREADAGNIKEAMYWCNEAIRRDPSWIAPYSLRGSLHEKNGDYDEAVEDYSKAVELADGVPDYYIDRGRAFEALGDIDQAVSDYSSAILSDTKGDYTVQGWAEQRAGRFGPNTVDEMVEVFEMAIANDPNNARFRQALGDLRQAKLRSREP